MDKSILAHRSMEGCKPTGTPVVRTPDLMPPRMERPSTLEDMIVVLTAVAKCYGEDGKLRLSTYDLQDTLDNYELSVIKQDDPAVWIIKAERKSQ